MSEILSNLWKLLTSGTRVFLIVLIAASVMLLLLPDKAAGNLNTALWFALVIAASGIIVELMAQAWTFIKKQYRAVERERDAGRSLEKLEAISFGRLAHLKPGEASILGMAIRKADEAGVFRSWWNYDSDIVNYMQVLRDCNLVTPADKNPFAETYYVEFWALTPMVLRRRSEVLQIVDHPTRR